MTSENIVGPFGAGVNETTTRPADPDAASATDTWFQDCIGGVAGTGTKVPAVWLNKVTALFRRAIRGMGIPDDSQDDDMLLKAIQKTMRGIADKGDPAAGVAIQAGIDGATGNYLIRRIRGSGVTVALDPETGEVVLTVGGDAVSLIGLAPVLMIEQRRANLVTAPAVTQNAWNTRPLTNIVGDNQIAGASLVSNQIILPAGQYRAQFAGTASNAGHHRSRLMDLTHNVMLGQGNSSDSHMSTTTGVSVSTLSIGLCHFKLTAQATIELQTYATNGSTGGTIRMGDGSSEDQDIGSGNYHVDGWVEIVKEA
jgi:hypothetical protein